MKSAMINTEIGAKNFVVEASRERVWRLIGKVIFSSLPGMEQVEILDDTSFRALLGVKVLLLEMTMRLKGEMVDMAPPASFGVNITIEGLGGLFRMKQKVTIEMTSIEKGKTAVACRARAEDMGVLLRWLSVGQARRFAHSVFASIEKRLQDLA
jgi:carbon monoxide dehydrogenase subunit G